MKNKDKINVSCKNIFKITDEKIIKIEFNEKWASIINQIEKKKEL